MADVERALFLTQPDVIPPGDWSRLYFGSEFCPWAFPGPATLAAALATARRLGFPFTLVTPVVSEPFLPLLRRALQEILPHLQEGDEVVVSDLGTIRLIRQLAGDDVEIAIGRVLSGQKRGPRILDLELNREEADYFRRGSWYQDEAVAFLAEQGIARVELDNLLQGIAPLPDSLAGTLHVPWAMVTSSRNCPFREPGRTTPCPGGCGEVMRLTTPQSPVPLYQGGNSQFLRNDARPDDLPGLGIDRTVEHLSLPR